MEIATGDIEESNGDIDLEFEVIRDRECPRLLAATPTLLFLDVERLLSSPTQTFYEFIYQTNKDEAPRKTPGSFSLNYELAELVGLLKKDGPCTYELPFDCPQPPTYREAPYTFSQAYDLELELESAKRAFISTVEGDLLQLRFPTHKSLERQASLLKLLLKNFNDDEIQIKYSPTPHYLKIFNQWTEEQRNEWSKSARISQIERWAGGNPDSLAFWLKTESNRSSYMQPFRHRDLERNYSRFKIELEMMHEYREHDRTSGDAEIEGDSYAFVRVIARRVIQETQQWVWNCYAQLTSEKKATKYLFNKEDRHLVKLQQEDATKQALTFEESWNLHQIPLSPVSSIQQDSVVSSLSDAALTLERRKTPGRQATSIAKLIDIEIEEVQRIFTSILAEDASSGERTAALIALRVQEFLSVASATRAAEWLELAGLGKCTMRRTLSDQWENKEKDDFKNRAESRVFEAVSKELSKYRGRLTINNQ
ncbi:hypothetical protein H8B13_05470 [Hymenobacter sp. BT188]|nr:hypothetical protein [Hymenobacter sp. BT188]